MSDKIQSYMDLKVWQTGHDLVLSVYRLTELFPQHQRFSLVDQLQRAVVSITSNIAEGFGRQGKKEKQHFYAMAKSSALEVQNQLLIAKDLSYIQASEYEQLSAKIITIAKMLSGLINKTEGRPPNS